MIKVISFWISLVLLASGGIKGGQAGGDRWFIKHKNAHEQPVCDRQFEYINDYDAFYLDHASNESNPMIYLTFDIGYENDNVTKILDVMKEEDVKGAFFILDNLIYRCPALLKRMREDGHLICNHTAKHINMALADEETFKAELLKMETLYRERCGQEIAKYYRPPEGSIVEENLKWAQDLGYKTILWSFAYPDWDNSKQPNAEKAKEKILKNTHPGEIVLLHPTSETNACILRDLIRAWKEMGYSFGTLDNLEK